MGYADPKKQRDYNREWYHRNLERARKNQTQWAANNPEKIRRLRTRFLTNYPWRRLYRNAEQRCNNPKNNRYYCYGARGIKFCLTMDECKRLWFRDKACDMKQPSIDRIDNDGGYTFGNCRVIEFTKNTRHKIEEIKL